MDAFSVSVFLALQLYSHGCLLRICVSCSSLGFGSYRPRTPQQASRGTFDAASSMLLVAANDHLVELFLV